MGKPDKINEVQWAKRGWTCVGRDRVGCVGGCGSEVVIKLEKDQEHQMSDEFDEENQHQDGEASAEGEDEDWRQSAQEQLVDKYAEMIITEHGGGCPWRRKGCDGTNQCIERLRLFLLIQAVQTRSSGYHWHIRIRLWIAYIYDMNPWSGWLPSYPATFPRRPPLTWIRSRISCRESSKQDPHSRLPMPHRPMQVRNHSMR